MKKSLFVFVLWFYTASCQKCEGNHFGYSCEQICGPNCYGGCDRFTGNCDLGCNKGYFSDWCVETCNAGCNEGCDQSTGRCHTCNTGKYGVTCEFSCGPNCKYGCNRKTGYCIGCEEGWFGYFCDKQCFTSCPGGCDQVYGGCEKCVTGNYGKRCTEELCLSGDDSCIGCVAGYYGKYCENTCPLNCNTECNQDGACYSCKPGFYGDTCETSCPGNCSGHCDAQGQCYGCKNNLYGKLCNRKCPARCKTEQCDQISGRCLEYTGTQPILDPGAQDRKEAERLKSKISFPLIPILIACGVVIVLLFAIFVISRMFLLSKKVRKNRRPKKGCKECPVDQSEHLDIIKEEEINLDQSDNMEEQPTSNTEETAFDQT